MPTMADVAARAGVSVATVSRALSGDRSRVSAPVLQRIIEAAEELAYTPNNLARNMRSGSARILGLVISDIGNPFFTAVARGAEDVARHHGYSLVLSNTDENPEREAASLAVMAAERAAGIIIATTNENGTTLRRALAMGMAIVAIDRHITGIPTDSVVVDNESAAHEAVTHLVRLGHRRIAIIGGPADADTARERLRGYERALREARIPVMPELVREGDFREAAGLAMTRQLLDLAEPPSAIFAVNNLTTIGVLGALRERGIEVPSDISVVGFDDIPTGELLHPPLTVIQQPTYRVGAHAAKLLLRRLREPGAAIQEVVLAARLIVRGSTGPFRQARGDGAAARPAPDVPGDADWEPPAMRPGER
jgi:DNA-binding LacI/PurR family transcriptional regulator